MKGYAICCNIFVNDIELYYVSSDCVNSRDIVLGYCSTLDDVNNLVNTLKGAKK